MRRYEQGDMHLVNTLITYLQQARTAAVHVRAPRTLAKVRAALKSAEGARRHIERLQERELREART